MHKHMHIHGPSVCPVPLPRSQHSCPPQGPPTCWLVRLDASCKRLAPILIPQALRTHARPADTPHSQVALDSSTDSCLPDIPAWSQQLLLTGKSSLKFASERDKHAHFREVTGTHHPQQPASGTGAVTCCPTLAAAAEPLTRLTHTSPSQ